MKRAFAIVPIVLLLVACAGTRTAYDAADTPDRTAYVVAEHYAALVKEAADLKDAGTLRGSALEAVQAADRKAKPLVIGDPDATPPKAGLRQLAEAYVETRASKDEITLQAALNKAVIAVSEFIDALKGVRQ